MRSTIHQMVGFWTYCVFIPPRYAIRNEWIYPILRDRYGWFFFRSVSKLTPILYHITRISGVIPIGYTYEGGGPCGYPRICVCRLSQNYGNYDHIYFCHYIS